MKATKPIEAGEQIFNDYGPLPRSDLLRMYGYITENYAQYDVVEISHDLLLEVAGKKHGAQDTAWLKREEQLDELGVTDDGYAIPRPAHDVEKVEDAIPGQVHMLLRALCTGATKSPKQGITLKEVALLQSVLTKRLSEYDTSVQADKSLLHALQKAYSNGALKHLNFRRQSMALQVRIGEKEILQQMMQLCQNHIAEKTAEIAAGSLKRPAEHVNSQRQKAARQRGN